MLEFEKKMMLTRGQYSCLRYFLCRCSQSSFQSNYYFDSDDFMMNRRGITCRIRCKDGVYTATVKNHNCCQRDCSTEQNLSVGSQFDPTVFSSLGVHFQGELITERIVVHRDDYCQAVLDRNTYLGTTDYELEVEYTEGYEHAANRVIDNIINTLATHSVTVSKDDLMRSRTKSKSARFFDRKEQLQV